MFYLVQKTFKEFTKTKNNFSNKSKTLTNTHEIRPQNQSHLEDFKTNKQKITKNTSKLTNLISAQ